VNYFASRSCIFFKPADNFHPQSTNQPSFDRNSTEEHTNMDPSIQLAQGLANEVKNPKKAMHSISTHKPHVIMCRCCPYGPVIFKTEDALTKHQAQVRSKSLSRADNLTSTAVPSFSTLSDNERQFTCFGDLPVELRLKICRHLQIRC